MKIQSKLKLAILGVLAAVALLGCARGAARYQPVQGFQLDRYLGRWYELVRYPHRFEDGLSNVTADYSLMEDKSVRVLNRGYRDADKKWSQAQGIAKPSKSPAVGQFRVSFFRPFWGPYIIIDLDKQNYQYALVTSGDNYFWILSREPNIPQAKLEELIRKGESFGFKRDQMIIVKHDPKK